MRTVCFMTTTQGINCKDCDAVHSGNRLIADGWRYLRLVEEDDIANGWRCPGCHALWKVLDERYESNASLH
jgi:hypothetical protein